MTELQRSAAELGRQARQCVNTFDFMWAAFTISLVVMTGLASVAYFSA